MKILKQTVGIDVAYKKLDVSLGRMDERLIAQVYAYKTFDNTQKGFLALTSWVKKQMDLTVPVRFVMEATGVYHERLARYLSERNHTQTIVTPNKITNFFRTLEVKTVTDKSMSAAIALFGLEKTLEDWVPPADVYRELRQLTRERDQLINERTVNKNNLHAEESEAFPVAGSIKRVKLRIKMINAQLSEITSDIISIVKDHPEVAAALELITSVPGVGMLSGVTILAETNAFSLIENKRQLSSYAGFDIKLKESGTSVREKPQISKKGNRHLRKVMHMPALAAIRHSEKYKNVFIRIVGKTGIKMKAVVAVQRMLLEMTYTVYKTKIRYDKDYIAKQSQKEAVEVLV